MIVVSGVDESVQHIIDGIEQGSERGLDKLAEHAETLFNQTTATWNSAPRATTDRSPGERRVGIADQRYDWVSNGTRPHFIFAGGRALRFQAGYSAKTAPGVVGSSGGGASGPVIFRKRIRHPGITARKFDEAIAPLVEAQAEQAMTAALQAELS